MEEVISKVTIAVTMDCLDCHEVGYLWRVFFYRKKNQNAELFWDSLVGGVF